MNLYEKVAAFLILSGAAIWIAVDAIRFRQWRKVILCFASLIPLLALSVGFFWLAKTNPTFNLKNNLGFPADWSCLRLGKGASVCGPDGSPAAVHGAEVGAEVNGGNSRPEFNR